jgi:hypothetical protein
MRPHRCGQEVVASGDRFEARGSVATKKVSAPADKVLLYQKLLDSVDGVDTKSNFGSAYTAVNGNMYTMISKHGVVGIRSLNPIARRSWKSIPPICFEAILPGRRPRSSWRFLTSCWPTPQPSSRISN